MSEYIVSARKYRPTTFDTVVGQGALVKTLKNAIGSGKLAHAYLFCGPRGVGKTTCARIFAKTINCEHRTKDGEACNECESCQSFIEQRSYNIHELDAASNNSVDNIRELIDQVKIPPQIGKYKVFIIDEVHMLSQAAFNAFLKTLEEPPKHALFIMATTEKQKILPTILSRCQTYDFQRITNQDIVAQLAYIASKEGIKAEPQALQVIAQKADGGMRDALSIFDQIASFTGGELTYQATISNLNILDYELFFRLTDAAIQGNIPAALMMLDGVIRRGFDPQHFIGGWASHIRDLMVSTDPATLQLIEAGPEVAHKYQEQATKCSPQFLYYGLQIANECDFNYKNSRNKRLSVELAVCRICQIMHPLPPMASGPQPLQSVKPQQVAAQPTVAPQQAAPQQVAPQQATVQQPVQRPAVSQPVQRPAFVAQPVQQPTPQPVQRETGNRFTPQTGMAPRRMASIRGITSSQSATKLQDNSSIQNNVELNEAVNPTDLLAAWKQFAVENAGEHLLTGLMNECVPMPVSADNLKYEVTLMAEQQKTLLDSNRERIMNYLISKVRNSRISLSYVVNEATQGKRMFTSREKFQAIKENHETIVSALSDNFNIELA